MRLTEYAHQQIIPHIQLGDVVVDATVGNGHDTVFLAELIGSDGVVYGFDLQELAIETTQMILKTRKLDSRCKLVQKGHECMLGQISEQHVGSISIVMFNLGYLPHGDKSIITKPETTIFALEQASSMLKDKGLISILAYRGHDGGIEEYEAVAHWFGSQSDLNLIEKKDSTHPHKMGPVFWLYQKAKN